MRSSSLSVKHIASLILVPVWTTVLVLPFTGIGSALELGAVAAALVLLWRAIRLRQVSSYLRGVRGRMAGLPFQAAEIRSRLLSPRALLLLVPLLIILPVFLNDYFRDVLTLTCLYTILALGLNIVVGQTGLLNLGYAAFYAIGAYVYAILSTGFGLSFWPGLFVGAATAGAFAALLGLPTLKLKGDYFAIVTLGLGEITRIILNNWDGMTGGPNGISNIGRPVIGSYTLHSTLAFYYLFLFLAILTVLAMHRLIDSRIGRAWIAIREDDVAAEAMGINTFMLKLLAFVIGSAWAGMAGVLFASKMAFVSPESFTFFESVLILCMVVLGGMGSIPGIILGALLLTILPEVFRDFQDYRMLAFGAALVLMMIFRPQGLLGTVRAGKA